MKKQQLQAKVKSGEIDTIIAAFPDVFGRLVGKRFVAQFFLDEVADHGTHACNYLLAVNIEMDPLDGFAIANWENGFGDFEMRPDWNSPRLIPWLPGTALIFCDYHREEGGLVDEAPRSVLRRQLENLARRKWESRLASELEFFLYNQTYHDIFANDYRHPTPSSDYRVDYQILQPSRDEALMRAVRQGMLGAGVPVENSKGEWGRGQHEINFTYGEPLEVADNHILFKHGVKEIAAQYGKAVTFMPKPFAQEVGSSCHIHLSLWRGERSIFWDEKSRTGSKTFRQFMGGLLKYSPELCYFFGPTINSYKRYQPASWAPTKMAWAHDNRTVGFRVVGSNRSFRIENRMPGADANPYLAFAAMIAAGMAGIEEGLDCGDCYVGNAYADAKLRALPHSLSDAAELLDKSDLARRAFGEPVVEFYVHTARLEAQAYDNAVTDWERARYFERI